MSTNIYEQAIAEAKKLREVAEQNAKNAIIEAITPRVRELIDKELTNSSDFDSDFLNEEYYEDEDIILEESALLELAKEISEKKEDKEDQELKEKDDHKEVTESSIVKMIDSLMEEEKEEIQNEEEEDQKETSETLKESYKNEEDMNLEELLNEIKMEIDLGEIEDEEIESALLELMPTVKMIEETEDEGDVDVEEPADEPVEEPAEGDEEGGEDNIDFDFSSLEDAGEEKEEEPVEEVFSINEASLSRELERLRNNRSSNSSNEKQNINESRYREQLLQEQRNNRELKGKLEEYKGAVIDLRDQLNEMNLFNAKLLYVNKLLQTKGLDSSQKKTIIESIDNAESLREVKLVYKTLSESVNKSKTGSLNESKIRRRASSSSRPTKSGGTLLNESSHQVDRWARLAGLK